jgi:hypothetical protein
MRDCAVVIRAQVALRLFHTLWNSVPSERSFPTRFPYLHPPHLTFVNTLNSNMIQDKKWNRHGAQTADRLAYIHVNVRILERGDQDPRSWHELPTPGLVEFEEDAQEAYHISHPGPDGGREVTRRVLVGREVTTSRKTQNIAFS